MKKGAIVLFLLMSGNFSFADLDPLPTLPLGPVNPQYIYKEYDVVVHPVGTEPEGTVHCLFPGETCRFTAEPQN